MPPTVLAERLERRAPMGVRHRASRDAPQPLDAVGIGIVWRGVGQPQLLAGRGEQLPDQLRPRRRVRAEVVGDDDGDPPPRLRARERRAPLLAEGVSGAPGGEAPVEPAVTPVDQAEAVDLGVGPRGLDQPLPAAPPAAPHARQRGMEGDVDLALEVDIGAGRQRQQRGDVTRHGIQQRGLDEIGERG